MINGKERRNYPRVKIKLPVVKMAGNGIVKGEIRDLSLGGAFIRCPDITNTEAEFQMVISARGRLMSIIGEVVWQKANKNRHKTAFPEMGVRFKQIFNGDRRFLQEIIASHCGNRLTAWFPSILRTNR